VADCERNVLSQTRVQIGQQCFHLRIVKPSSKRRHHALSSHDDTPNLHIRCWSTTWQLRLVEHSMQIGRDLLQGKIVLFMAMGAPDLIEMLSFHLLLCQLRGFPAARHAKNRNQNHPRPADRLNSHLT